MTKTRITAPPSRRTPPSDLRLVARPAAVVVAVVAAALTIRIPGTPVSGFDTTYAVAWGRDLITGYGLSTPAGAPTQHPLGILLGIPLAVTGSHAPAVAGLIAAIAFMASVLLVADIGMRLAGNSRYQLLLAASVAIVLLARPQLVYLVRMGSFDWVYAALLLGAVSLRFARRLGWAIVLASLAALHRPEAWILALMLLYPLLRTGWHRRDGATRRPMVSAAIAATLAPAIWLILGALAGDQLAALHTSQQNAASLGRDTGFWVAVASTPSAVATLVGWPICILGTIALVWFVSRRRRIDGTSTYLTAVAVTAVGPIVSAGSGAAVLTRYQLTTAILIVAAAVAGVAYCVTQPRTRMAAVAIAAAVGLATMLALPQYADMTRIETTQLETWQSLTGLVHSNRSACGPLWSPSYGATPLAALEMEQPLSRFRDLPPKPPGVGTLIHPSAPADVAAAGYSPPQNAQQALRIPPAFALTAANDHWAIYQRC